MSGLHGVFTGAIILVLAYEFIPGWLYGNSDPEDSASHSVHNGVAEAWAGQSAVSEIKGRIA